VGPPNAGKSSLVERLTRASPEVALYPFTTRRPVPGMMRFENVLIQLVDTPPVTRDYLEPGMGTLLRSANLIVLVADLGADDPIAPLEGALSQLETLGLCVSASLSSSEAEVKRALWMANKSDCPTAAENLEILGEFLPRPWIVLSAKTGEGTGHLPRRAFEALEVIRIYTKPPGKSADMDEPTVLGRGATVLDAATAVHRDFAHRLRFVRLWREDRPSGIKVDRDHVLTDGDIIEFHVERSV
jgi:ribosome-interacting GTPase 1